MYDEITEYHERVKQYIKELEADNDEFDYGHDSSRDSSDEDY